MQNITDRIESFISKAKIIHDDESYDYSRVFETYVNNKTPVCIIDHSIIPNTEEEYGEFWITPSNLLKGRKNPLKKGLRISKSKQMSQDEFVNRCKEVHKGENLDYSKTIYKGAHKKICIIDHSLRPDGTEYGEYWQEANSHLRGCGHPDKAVDAVHEKQRSNTADFITKAEKLYKEKYTYDKVHYIDNRSKVIVTCPIHGDFLISPDNFLSGKSCPSCGHHLSKAENELSDYVKTLLGENSVVTNDHTILNGKEVDIYVPSKKIAIEYNGLRWHSEEFGKYRNYHLEKLNECNKKGVNLIQIFEDEYLYNKDIVLSKIKHILGCNHDLCRVMARKCTVCCISKDDACIFLNKNHIQGFVEATVHFGCYYNDKLVGVMSFKKERDSWNLVRFATDIDYICQGVGGKLFKCFVDRYQPDTVKTFLDRRWERDIENNFYTKIGFRLDKIERPDYRYTNGHGLRLHKFGFRKNILHRKYNLPLSMTEGEMTSKMGYYKIWDCGLIKYIWTSKNKV